MPANKLLAPLSPISQVNPESEANGQANETTTSPPVIQQTFAKEMFAFTEAKSVYLQYDEKVKLFVR